MQSSIVCVGSRMSGIGIGLRHRHRLRPKMRHNSGQHCGITKANMPCQAARLGIHASLAPLVLLPRLRRIHHRTTAGTCCASPPRRVMLSCIGQRACTHAALFPPPCTSVMSVTQLRKAGCGCPQG